MIQFLAHTAEQAAAAIAAGCTWIHCADPSQLDAMIEPCREADVILTLQGSPSKVMDTRIHGVVLAPSDISAAEAREFLGPHAIIGCNVTTLFEILNLAPLDVDFFVLDAPAAQCGEIIRLARCKGVEQRISALNGTREHLEAGADALLTSDLSVV